MMVRAEGDYPVRDVSVSREADLSQEFLESTIGSHGIKSGIDAQVGHPLRSLIIGLLEGGKGFLRLTQTEIHAPQGIRRHIPLL